MTGTRQDPCPHAPGLKPSSFRLRSLASYPRPALCQRIPLRIQSFPPTATPATLEGTMRRLANRVRISSLNLCQNKVSFLTSHPNSRTIVLQSQTDAYQTTDKDLQLTPFFFVCALASDNFVCLASGFFLSETDRERFLDSDESVCCSVLQRQLKMLVPRKKVSGRSWWNTRRNT